MHAVQLVHLTTFDVQDDKPEQIPAVRPSLITLPKRLPERQGSDAPLSPTHAAPASLAATNPSAATAEDQAAKVSALVQAIKVSVLLAHVSLYILGFRAC